MSVFESMTDYLAVPRVSGLLLSPDGSRLVATVATRSRDRKKFVTALWEIDPQGRDDARRLTFSAEGDSAPAFLPDGRLLFLSKRPDRDPVPAGAGTDSDTDPDTDAGEDTTGVWLLPSTGEARRIATRRGGYDAIAVAADAGTVVLAAETLPAARTEADDARLRKERADLDVNAILHEASPVRYWDHDLGPGELRLQVAAAPTAAGALDTRELTPQPGRGLDEQPFVISRDGATVVTGWVVQEEPGLRRTSIVVVDTTSGARRTLVEEPLVLFEEPDISADGRQVVCIRTVDGSYDDPPRRALWILDVATGVGRELAPGSDLWPSNPTFSPDGRRVFFTSDDDGRHPVFRADVGTGVVTRIANDGHYSHLCIGPDGRRIYALRDRIDAPPVPVRLDADLEDQAGEPLPAPGTVAVPGRVAEVEAAGRDGQRVRGWLVLPERDAEQPAPLVLWVHGGPLSSWNGWSWRWNPWLLAARGYAVLLPDPALSTGYGEKMLRRGWGQWGGAPYDDLMAITDVAAARPDIDESRTAVMGGSYGGYMANWIAGHTDRFRCIVTHASLWSLEAFMGTTDLPAFWIREWGAADVAPERYEQWSPNRFADDIRTPMLVIHGDKDYRVPVGEGLALWWDLQRRGVESKFLYFPDENHWILSPGAAQVWYETVYAWLAAHVLDEPWQRPALV